MPLRNSRWSAERVITRFHPGVLLWIFVLWACFGDDLQLSIQAQDFASNPRLQAWYRADAGVISTNGSHARYWLDQSIYQRHLSSFPLGDAFPPVIVSNTVPRPYVRFSGYNRSFISPVFPGIWGPMNLREHTIFIVYRQHRPVTGRDDGIIGFRSMLLADAHDDGDNPALEGRGTNGLSFSQRSSKGVVYRANFSGTPIDTRGYAAHHFTLATFGFSTNLFLRRNGQFFDASKTPPEKGDLIVDTITLSCHTRAHTPQGVNDLWINDIDSGGRNDIAEILIYDTALAPEEISALEDHLMTKYELPYPGDLKLLSARKLVSQEDKVQVKFSAPPDRDSALQVENYELEPEGKVLEILPDPDSKSFTLTTTPLDPQLTYYLRAHDILDGSGKTLLRDNARVLVQTNRLDPLEITTKATLPGHLDDFGGPGWHSSWLETGTGNAYRKLPGILRITPSAAGPSHFLFQPSIPYNDTEQEILARIRILYHTSESALSGVSLVVGQDEAGMNFSVHGKTEMNEVKIHSYHSADSMSAAFSWKPERWYWMRIKHSAAPSPQVLARIWEANGDTEEPGEWITRTYAGPVQRGRAGLTASSEDSSEFEVDWILIKATGLPPVEVVPPEPFDLSITIKKRNEEILVRWPAYGRHHALEFAPSLDEPWEFIFPGPEETERGFEYTVPPEMSGHGFFRLIR